MVKDKPPQEGIYPYPSLLGPSSSPMSTPFSCFFLLYSLVKQLYLRILFRNHFGKSPCLMKGNVHDCSRSVQSYGMVVVPDKLIRLILYFSVHTLVFHSLPVSSIWPSILMVTSNFILILTLDLSCPPQPYTTMTCLPQVTDGEVIMRKEKKKAKLQQMLGTDNNAPFTDDRSLMEEVSWVGEEETQKVK